MMPRVAPQSAQAHPGRLGTHAGFINTESAHLDRLLALVIEGLERAIEAIEWKETPARHGLDPVFFRHTFRFFRCEVDIHRAVFIGRWVLLAADARQRLAGLKLRAGKFGGTRSL
jgi:hypothetical protein